MDASDPHPASERVLNTVAFGSCADQRKPQPIWDAILEQQPDLFVFLGDNVYGDSRDPAVLRAAYAALHAQPGFRRLRDSVPIAAIWDDHDYGENDAGADYPQKAASKELFLDFWGEPVEGARWKRDGVFVSYGFGPPDKRVQLILPDLRYHRTPLVKADLGIPYKELAAQREAAGLPVSGPYVPDHADGATMLGEAQWAWLDPVLRTPASWRLFGSSIQALAEPTGWESWANFVDDRRRLMALLRTTGAEGLLFLSGDMHWGELSRLVRDAPYPLYDLTSSGLTETWSNVAPNARRLGEPVRDANFGIVAFDWRAAAATLRLHAVDGSVRLSQRVLRSDLTAARPASPAPGPLGPEPG